MSKFVGMLKGPEALPSPKLAIISCISLASQGSSTKLRGLGSFRYDIKLCFAFGIFCSIDGPTFTKYLFKALDILLLSVKVLLSWIILLILIEDFFETLIRERIPSHVFLMF